MIGQQDGITFKKPTVPMRYERRGSGMPSRSTGSFPPGL